METAGTDNCRLFIIATMIKITPSRVLTFLVIGFFVALFQYCIFYLFIDIFDLNYLVSSGTSFFLTVLVSFFLQRNITFRGEDGENEIDFPAVRLLFFGINSILGLLLNVLIVFALVNLLYLSPYVGQVISMAVLAVYNFFAYRFLLR